MRKIEGVFAAALTPMDENFSFLADDLLQLLHFLAQRGCHGTLLLGTTGEGPSFATHERISIMREAVKIRQVHPDFQLLVGAGTPSLEETIGITQAAFAFEMDGVVVLPPYYYRGAHEEGLFSWYAKVIEQAVPPGCQLLGYHIPSLSGVPLKIDLISRLKDAYPDRFAGIKDSSSDLEYAKQLGERFGEELIVFSGNDRLFSYALSQSASGCITSLANIYSPELRVLWESYQRDEPTEPIQIRINTARDLIEKYPPAAPLLKFLISHCYHFPQWTVKPPLMPISDEVKERILRDADIALGIDL